MSTYAVIGIKRANGTLLQDGKRYYAIPVKRLAVIKEREKPDKLIDDFIWMCEKKNLQ